MTPTDYVYFYAYHLCIFLVPSGFAYRVSFYLDPELTLLMIGEGEADSIGECFAAAMAFREASAQEMP